MHNSVTEQYRSLQSGHQLDSYKIVQKKFARFCKFTRILHNFVGKPIERAVHMVAEAASEYSSQWAAIESIAAKIGCTPETLRRWVRQQERDTGHRAGPTTAEEERIKTLERENRELRKTNEILRLANAFFAQAELDRRFKP